MNERQPECMAHSEKIPSEGGGGSEPLYTQQSVVCGGEK